MDHIHLGHKTLILMIQWLQIICQNTAKRNASNFPTCQIIKKRKAIISLSEEEKYNILSAF